jgi:hypothetical protein
LIVDAHQFARPGAPVLIASTKVKDMISPYHAVIWIDHDEARIIHFDASAAAEEFVRPAQPPRRVHAKVGGAAGTDPIDEPDFYHRVAEAFDGAMGVLIAGPSKAKTEFVKYLLKHFPHMLERIHGIETLARVTDHQLIAEGRRYFAKADHLREQLN